MDPILWKTFFCFFRIAPWLFLVPFFGYTEMPARIRGITAVILSIVIAPVVDTPPAPDSFLGVLPLVFPEMIIGAFLGLFIRVLFVLVDLVGFLFGFHLNLSNASIFNPTLGTQSSLAATFISLGVLAFLFECDVHHILLRGIVSSYQELPCLNYLADINQMLFKMMSSSLDLGVRLSMPVILVGTLFYIVIGILSRLMPGLQIFFVVMPAHILLTYIVVWMTMIPFFQIFGMNTQNILKMLP